MPIQQGIYVIRRNVVGIDNVIATGDGINDPILGLPNDQPDAQRWEVRAVGDDLYEIVKPGFLPGPPGGFGVDDIRPGEPVKLKSEPSPWVINSMGEERNVYSIQAVNGPIGATYAIDLEKRGGGQEELILKPFPVIADPPTLPGWSFIPVLED